MGNEVANVLVGVATLSIRQPNDALAEWSTAQKYAGSYSARLYKAGSGSPGSTHVQFTPATGITLANWTTGIAAGHYHYYHHSLNNENAAVNANYTQFEFKFEDPNSDAWLELTAVSLQNVLGGGVWVQELLEDADKCGYGGVGELGGSFFSWAELTALSGAEAAVNDEANVDTASDWVMTRVRVELWESSPERTAYIDSVTINNVLYAIEPGSVTSGLSLSSPYTDVGYTEDGVTLNYTVDTADIEVQEETFPVGRRITKETLEIVCNMAESSLYNLDKAIAGSVLSGSILTIGAGVLKEMSIKLTGTTPAGGSRSYEFPRVTATGSVGMSFKKGEKTIVPLTFQALKPSVGSVGTFVDNVA